eukprot:3286832-Pyramimonas_sp.AAC.1
MGAARAPCGWGCRQRDASPAFLLDTSSLQALTRSFRKWTRGRPALFMLCRFSTRGFEPPTTSACDCHSRASVPV